MIFCGLKTLSIHPAEWLTLNYKILNLSNPVREGFLFFLIMEKRGNVGRPHLPLSSPPFPNVYFQENRIYILRRI